MQMEFWLIVNGTTQNMEYQMNSYPNIDTINILTRHVFVKINTDAPGGNKVKYDNISKSHIFTRPTKAACEL